MDMGDMCDNVDIIQVLPTEFEALRHGDLHAAIKQQIEDAIMKHFKAVSARSSRPSRGHHHHRKPAAERWSSTRPEGKRPLNPGATVIPENTVRSLCNKLSQLNYAKLQPTILKHAESDPDMVIVTLLQCCIKNGYYTALYVDSMRELRRGNKDLVDTHVDSMSETFLKTREYVLVDETDSDDYDVFCAFVAEKKRRMTRFEFLCSMGKYEDMIEALPEIVTELQNAQSDANKDMMIAMLIMHRNHGNRQGKRVKSMHTADTYEPLIDNCVRYGIGAKAKFKLVDLVSDIKRSRFG